MTDGDAQLPVEPGTVVLGKYRVNHVIGAGGMGMVAEAWHLDFDEKVAIKFLLQSLLNNEEAVGRFEREARVLFKIKSDNVCRVIDVGKLDNGVPVMVMEYLDGCDLAVMLERREPLPFDHALEYGLQACQALANAHVRGIVHRDLKPENLFLAKDPTGEMAIKLLDFGLSKDHSDEEAERGRKLTANEQVMGTPHYMSPEQWMSSTSVNAASDQWALAAIIFEMMTGYPPFDGPKLANICSAIMNTATPSLLERRPDLPPGLDVVLKKALEKHPNDRYENVGALAVALAAFSPRPAVVMKAERTLKMLQRAELNEEDVSGAWQNLPRAPRAPSDMAATMKSPPKFEIFERVRSVTSTSWQRIMRTQRASKAAVAAAVFMATALAGAAVYTIVQTAPQSTPISDETTANTTSHATDAVPPSSAADTDTAPASTAPLSAPSASASSEEAPDPPSNGNGKKAKTKRKAKPRAMTPPRPTPKPKDASKKKPKPDIFNDR